MQGRREGPSDARDSAAQLPEGHEPQGRSNPELRLRCDVSTDAAVLEWRRSPSVTRLRNGLPRIEKNLFFFCRSKESRSPIREIREIRGKVGNSLPQISQMTADSNKPLFLLSFQRQSLSYQRDPW